MDLSEENKGMFKDVEDHAKFQAIAGVMLLDIEGDPAQGDILR